MTLSGLSSRSSSNRIASGTAVFLSCEVAQAWISESSESSPSSTTALSCSGAILEICEDAANRPSLLPCVRIHCCSIVLCSNGKPTRLMNVTSGSCSWRRDEVNFWFFRGEPIECFNHLHCSSNVSRRVSWNPVE